MTEQPNDEQLARLARLGARQRVDDVTPAAARPPRRRRHAAQGSRIAAAGVAATTALGIVAMLGVDTGFTSAEEPSLQPATGVGIDPSARTTGEAGATAPVAPPIRIVIHRVPATTIAAGPVEIATEIQTTSTASTLAPSTTIVPAAPVELTATPVVKTVTVAAPAQSSSASPGGSTPQPAPATSKGSS